MGVPFYFGGVSVLIVVQVAIDTMRKIEAQQYSILHSPDNTRVKYQVMCVYHIEFQNVK